MIVKIDPIEKCLKNSYSIYHAGSEIEMKVRKRILVPERVRKINGSFSYIPHTFVTEGFFESLTQEELLLYFLLALVGDRHGLSYYSQDRLCTRLKMPLDDFITARNGLIEKSLIAFDGFMFQVLSLPEEPIIKPLRPLNTEQDFSENDPLTIRKIIKQELSKH